MRLIPLLRTLTLFCARHFPFLKSKESLGLTLKPPNSLYPPYRCRTSQAARQAGTVVDSSLSFPLCVCLSLSLSYGFRTKPLLAVPPSSCWLSNFAQRSFPPPSPWALLAVRLSYNSFETTSGSFFQAPSPRRLLEQDFPTSNLRTQAKGSALTNRRRRRRRSKTSSPLFTRTEKRNRGLITQGVITLYPEREKESAVGPYAFFFESKKGPVRLCASP